MNDCHKDGHYLTADYKCVCIKPCCNEGGFCICPDENRLACDLDHRSPPTPTGVILTEAELAALADFFGEDGTMEDDVYERVGRKFRDAAAKAGLRPFFEVGKTYRRGRKTIAVAHVDTHPVKGDRYAHGWITETFDGTPSESTWPGSVKVFTGWKEVTE